MIMKRTNAENMISICHIDRGINMSAEMKLIIQHLKHNPDHFNDTSASSLERLCDIIGECFHDCYRSIGIESMNYETIISIVNHKEEKSRKKDIN